MSGTGGAGREGVRLELVLESPSEFDHPPVAPCSRLIVTKDVVPLGGAEDTSREYLSSASRSTLYFSGGVVSLLKLAQNDFDSRSLAVLRVR